MSQKALSLFESKPTLAEREVTGQLPPSRASLVKKPVVAEIDKPSPGPAFERVGDRWVHFVFARVHLYPPARRRVVRFEPEKIDTTRFLVSRTLPYPTWPLICKATCCMAFENEKHMHAYLSKHAPGYSIFKTWSCGRCRMLHCETFPHEVSGTTSGKSTRKDNFLEQRGIEH